MTTKEPQRICRQVASLEGRNQALAVRDPELLDLLDEQFDILRDYVGGQFKSNHQYLVTKADNMEALRMAQATLRAEIEGCSLMIKQATLLNQGDVIDMLSVIYQGRR